MQHFVPFLGQLFCCKFVAVKIMSSCMSQFHPSFSCETDGLTFCTRTLWNTDELIDSMNEWWPGHEVAKEAQIITPPPPCFTVGKS